MKDKSDKAQSILLTFMIILGLLMSAVAIYQGVIVPEEVSQSERKHELTTANQFRQLSSSIVKSGRTGNSYKQDIQVSLFYEEGFILNSPFPKITPPSPIGNISYTKFNKGITIENAVTPNLNNLNGTKDNYFINGSKTFNNTGYIKYDIQYNRLDNAPPRYYENSIWYDEYGKNKVYRNEQRLINGNEIKIPILRGTMDTTGTASTDLSITPVSHYQSGIILNSKGTENIVIKLPTRIDASEWQKNILNDQPVNQVNNISGENRVRIELEKGSYILKPYSVYVSNEQAERSLGVKYVDIKPSNIYVNESTTRSYDISARLLDKYGNPTTEPITVNINANNTEGNWIPDNEVDIRDQTSFSIIYRIEDSPSDYNIKFSSEINR